MYPEGAGILYATDRNGNERESYTLISVDGTQEREVIGYHEAFIRFGDFAPNGELVAFSSTARNGTDYDVYVGDVATGEYARIYEGSFANYAQAWQPNGSNVIVTETRGRRAGRVPAGHPITREGRECTEVASAYEELSLRRQRVLPATNEDREFSGLAFYATARRLPGSMSLSDARRRRSAMAGTSWTVNVNGYDELRLLDQERIRASPRRTCRRAYSIAGADHAPAITIGVNGPAIRVISSPTTLPKRA